MFNKHSKRRNSCMLTGSFAKKGYDWWWHSFTAIDDETGEEKPFFIEFFLCNPGLAESQPILGQSLENQKNKKRPSYVMVKAGCWGQDARQLHRFFSWKDVDVQMGIPYSVTADDCFASETRLKGSITLSEEEVQQHPEYMCDAGSMSWDLEVEKEIAFNVGYGAGIICRAIKAFEMYWHAEGMKSYYTGTITYQGRKYLVERDTSYGYADKNWGRNFTSPWVWLSSNHLISNKTNKQLKNSVFDIGGGKPKVYFIPIDRKLLGAFWYEGKEYEFNFSKFWTGTRTRFICKETEQEISWKVVQENRKALMKTMITCKKDDMLLVNYESPDGKKRHNRLWNGGNGGGRIQLYEKHKGEIELIDDISVYNVGCEYGEYD